MLFISTVNSWIYPYYCTSPLACDIYYRTPSHLLAALLLLGLIASTVGILLFGIDYRKVSARGGVGSNTLTIGSALYTMTSLGSFNVRTGGFGGPDIEGIVFLAFGFGISYLIMFVGCIILRKAYRVGAHTKKNGLDIFLVGLTVSTLGIATLIGGDLDFHTIYGTLDLTGLGLLIAGAGGLSQGYPSWRLRGSYT